MSRMITALFVAVLLAGCTGKTVEKDYTMYLGEGETRAAKVSVQEPPMFTAGDFASIALGAVVGTAIDASSGDIPSNGDFGRMGYTWGSFAGESTQAVTSSMFDAEEK
ncbi:MAG: hypothetical protein V3573_08930 [Desulfovibrionaceae bacterium]